MKNISLFRTEKFSILRVKVEVLIIFMKILDRNNKTGFAILQHFLHVFSCSNSLFILENYMQILVLILIYLRIDLYFTKIDKNIKRLDVHTCITITIHTQPYKQYIYIYIYTTLYIVYIYTYIYIYYIYTYIYIYYIYIYISIRK